MWPWAFGRSGTRAAAARQTPGLFDPADPGFASYFDGHFAITPLASTSKPCGVIPLQHHLRIVLERIGNDAAVVGVDDLALALRPRNGNRANPADA